MSTPTTSGTKSKSRKGRGRPPPNSLALIFQDEWSDSDSYVEIADQLCVAFKLPDLTTRGGLRRVHADLDNILDRLDEAFRHAKRIGNGRVMGGVISIYTKMCMVDALLQDKIVSRGWYERMIFLTTSPETRHVALRSINAVAYSSGKQMIHEFVHQAPALIKLLRDNPDEPAVSSLVPAIFAHAACSMPKERLSAIDTKELAAAVLGALRSPTASPWMFGHALSCLGADRISMRKACKDMPSYTTFRVALLRSQDVRRRFDMMCSLVCSYDQHKTRPGEDWHLCSTKLGHFLDKGQLSQKLQDILDEYGHEESQLYAAKRSNELYLAFVAEDNRQPNLLKLGRSLASLICHSEHSIPVHLCTCCGEAKHCHNCHPAWRWFDVVQLCIAALRSQDGPRDKEFADVLEWQYLATAKCEVNLLSFGQGAVERHPSCSLFRYVLGRVHLHRGAYGDALRMAKKGLKCPDVQPWIRRGLLRIGMVAAFHQSLRPGDIQERVALVQCAYEDAKTLMKEGPPDGFYRQYELYTFILISFIIEGDRCDPFTPGIEKALKEIKINEEFLEFMGNPLTNESQHVMTARKILDVMKDAIEEWDAMLKRTDDTFRAESDSSPLLCKDSAEESMVALNAWFNKFESEESKLVVPDDPNQETVPTLMDFTRFDRETIMCSWCGRPSVLLKKCKRCGVAKYCDAECQRGHWSTHKAFCGVELTTLSQAVQDIIQSQENTTMSTN